jgi:hypothetical protein
MSLPAGFWEEFDRRLDAKLEAKLEEKLEPIKNDIKQIKRWTQRQDEAIERELTMACFSHLENAYPGYLTIVPAKNVLGKIIKDSKGLTITDLDGAIVLTNDLLYANYLKGKTPDYKLNSGTKSHLIIIEAKQHVTAAKVKKKIEQRKIIEDLLKQDKLGPLKPVDKFIGFYIGGIEVDVGASTEIDRFLKIHEGQDFVGTLELNGSRFSVQDVKKVYGGRNLRIRQV